MGSSVIGEKLLLPNADDVEAALPKEFLDAFVARFQDDQLDEVR